MRLYSPADSSMHSSAGGERSLKFIDGGNGLSVGANGSPRWQEMVEMDPKGGEGGHQQSPGRPSASASRAAEVGKVFDSKWNPGGTRQSFDKCARHVRDCTCT